VESRDKVIAVVANAMRQILVDASRRKNAQKRIPAQEPDRTGLPFEDVLTLDTIVEVLRRENPRQARLVDCRFYLGMTLEETGMALGVPRARVEREWRQTRAWLEDRLQRKEATS
jgi:RNA polymerase sigma factor (TIGR02999 family)